MGSRPVGSPKWEVIHGDALRLIAEIPDASIDAVITDPPYSSGGMFRGDRAAKTSTKYVLTGQVQEWPEFSGDTRDQRGYLMWCALWLSECRRVTKPGAPVVLFTDWRQLPTTTDALQAGGFIWRGIASWDKTEAARPSMGAYRNQCEYLVWGTNGPSNTSMDVGCLPGAWRVPVEKGDEKQHMTGKPLDLMRQVVLICPPGGTILDPFAGSGTTIVAAREEGRSAIGFEITPAYAAIAQARLAAATGAPMLDFTEAK